MRVTVREWAIRVGLLVVSTLLAVALAEGLVRVFFPIYGGRENLTLDGKPIKEWFEPGSVYRQYSNEYDAVTTITDKGHRSPRVDGNPDVVFVGDSFTYGFGLTDDETFVSIYCSSRHLSCANLGQPGTGTERQMRRLEQFLSRWNWRPREVKLFFFGMSSSLSAGNDFVDNYDYGRWLARQSRQPAVASANGQPPVVQQAAARRGLSERIIRGWQFWLLEHSMLVVHAKYYWGPMLRSMMVADPGEQRMSEALTYTARGLRDLHALSQRYGFSYTIYLIVPVQDIIRHTHETTLAALNSVSPAPVVTTAPLFADSPQNFYYSYDGHLNPRGSRRVAEFLVEHDVRKAHR